MTLCSDKSSNECALALDFSQASAVEGWAAIDDRVMGGLSKSSLVHHPDGYAVFAGTVSLENGGGFASVRHPSLHLGDAQTVGCRLHVRGDGKRYKLNLRMDSDFDGVNHQALFQPPAGRWVDVVLPLRMFSARRRGQPAPGASTLVPGQVCQVGWMVGDGQRAFRPGNHEPGLLDQGLSHWLPGCSVPLRAAKPAGQRSRYDVSDRSRVAS